MRSINVRFRENMSTIVDEGKKGFLGFTVLRQINLLEKIIEKSNNI